jgi:hypothetical protein
VIASVRIVGLTNSLAVGVELAIVVVLGIALVVAVVLTSQGSTQNLFSQGIAAGAPNYFALGGGLMAALIMGLSTLVGFDAAANMAEEAKDPFRSVPRAIVGSVVAAAGLGFLFVIVLTVAITDMVRVSKSNSPVAEIMRSVRSWPGKAVPPRHRHRVLRCRSGHDGRGVADHLCDVARKSAFLRTVCSRGSIRVRRLRFRPPFSCLASASR